MHHDACRNRVPPALVESQLLDTIEKQRTLVSGAAAAGAKVHTLPARPQDIADDGEFHYAVLGPRAASEAGKPSAEARRFIDQTTTPDRPRVYRNAIHAFRVVVGDEAATLSGLEPDLIRQGHLPGSGRPTK